LQARSFEVVAIANPLRSVAGAAAHVRDANAGIGKPVIRVGHSYGGMVIT
jgi:pimeloyl-ACP methyl ester carboxylesterase